MVMVVVEVVEVGVVVVVDVVVDVIVDVVFGVVSVSVLLVSSSGIPKARVTSSGAVAVMDSIEAPPSSASLSKISRISSEF